MCKRVFCKNLNLKSVIENLKPYVLLIESRPEQLSNGNFADGPSEMLYSHLIAHKIGIPVKGVDWWTPADTINVPDTTNSTRDNYYIKKRIVYEKNCIGTVYKTKIFKDRAIASIEDFNRFSKIIEQTGETE